MKKKLISIFSVYLLSVVWEGVERHPLFYRRKHSRREYRKYRISKAAALIVEPIQLGLLFI